MAGFRLVVYQGRTHNVQTDGWTDEFTTDVQMRTVHLGIVETYIFLKSHSYKLAMSYDTTFTLALSLAHSSILTILFYLRKKKLALYKYEFNLGGGA